MTRLSSPDTAVPGMGEITTLHARDVAGGQPVPRVQWRAEGSQRRCGETSLTVACALLIYSLQKCHSSNP